MQFAQFQQNTAMAASGVPANPTSAGVIIEDLVQGLNQWRNIQDVVRLTFKSFHDVLRSQGEAIKVLERGLDNKATKSELAASLQQKANANDVLAKLREVETHLYQKADIADVERRALKTDVDASFRTQMSDVYTILNAKSEAADFKVWRDQFERHMGQLRADLVKVSQHVQDLDNELDTKAEIQPIMSALATKVDSVDLEIKLRDKVSKHVFSESLAHKADVVAVESGEADLRQRLADTNVALSRKAEMGGLEEVSGRVERLRNRVDSDRDAGADAVHAVAAACDRTVFELHERMARAEQALDAAAGDVQRLGAAHTAHENLVREVLALKADAEFVESTLASSLAVKADAAAVDDALDKKTDREDFELLLSGVQALAGLKSRLDALEQSSLHHIDKETHRRALESKVDSSYLKQIVEAFSQELELSVTQEELQVALRDAVSGEGTGRWLWNSRSTQSNNTVPWDVELVNTAPDIYICHPGRATLMVAKPGIYEVSLALFCPRGASAQLLVNGTCVVSIGGSSSTYGSPTTPSITGRGGAISSSSQPRISSPDNASAFSVMSLESTHTSLAALQTVNFLSLPLKAKLLVVYNGGVPAHGIIAIKRMQ